MAVSRGALRGAASGAAPLLALLAIGSAWGLTTPLTKIAVSTGYGPFTLLLWFSVIDVAALALVVAVTGRRLSLSGAHLRLYAVVACFGMVLPQVASYSAAPHLPSGVLSIVISLVPLWALPLTLVLGMERFRPVRALGLILGALAVALLVGPEGVLPDRSAAVFVLVAALGPLCYAIEGVYVDGWGTRAADPVQTLFGASLLALVIAVPLALATGQAVLPQGAGGVAERAVAASALLALLAYMSYVWLLRRTGAVFAGQVSYVVTGSGVVWSMLVLGERYDGWFWAALALLFAGLLMVRPRAAGGPAPAAVAPPPPAVPGGG